MCTYALSVFEELALLQLKPLGFVGTKTLSEIL
ncbi:Uncharacterised protein [Paenibacillus polymyxa]|nr:Uncharacterised protein [Paenibacillus polymyxa]